MNEVILKTESREPMSAVQIRTQVNLIQEIMQEVMKDGQHYGTIPGCGAKPTLLKPGAEKLSLTFRLRPIIDNDRDVRVDHLEDGHREVSVYCHVKNMDGIEIATGIGSCSTMESKYRYRGGEKKSTGEKVPKEYWNLKKEGKIDEAKKVIGGDGFGVAKFDGVWEICEIGQKMENPDIADTYNTVLKMAKKRAYVDGILSATAASDIFTQDIEDLPIETFQSEKIPSGNGKPIVDATVKGFPIDLEIKALAQKHFESADSYAAWRIENGLSENIKRATQEEKEELLNALKTVGEVREPVNS